MNKPIFVKFSSKEGDDIRNNLEHVHDVAVNVLKPESIGLFSGSVLVSNIIKKRGNGFDEIFMKYHAWHKE